ncbi:hypothetical protein LZZ90_11785 [Flavobacterium sp. SM15]|uniref:hypothetical protein n=1 Tax=Flavobacterium sp. SM15 TaxID=2908005 RepID=UPI001EDA7720|nr:hypothetical protein [Flavobacterium sp. SM15]MCG2612187.1 hypothetical protein [Flavobacterium sp. SM15]
MKTVINTNNVKASATILLVLLSSFLLSYSLVSYLVFGKDVSAAVLIISAVVFGKSMMAMQQMRTK